MQFGFTENELDAIQAENPVGSVRQWLSSMLNAKLNNFAGFSWNDVISALEALGQSAVAVEVRQKFCQKNVAGIYIYIACLQFDILHCLSLFHCLLCTVCIWHFQSQNFIQDHHCQLHSYTASTIISLSQYTPIYLTNCAQNIMRTLHVHTCAVHLVTSPTHESDQLFMAGKGQHYICMLFCVQGPTWQSLKWLR